jgi:hypothetical protein
MSQTPDDSTTVAARIRQSLETAQRRAQALRHRSTQLAYLGLTASALATIVAGIASAHGPLAGQGPTSWKLTCGLTAVFSACAALASGLNQQFSYAEHLARAMACAGRLRSLELQVSLGERSPSEIAREYEDLVANYAEFV